MTDETIFYILGITLTVSALVVSFLGIRNESFPGSLFPLLAAYFTLLVAGTMTFAVLNAETNTTERTENQEAAKELFGSGNAVAATASETAAPSAPEKPPEKAKGPGGTVKLAADPTELLYDTKKLSSKPGKVAIDFENPAQIEHDVAIAKGKEVLGKTDLIAQGKTSTTVELPAGTYTFFCTVPGHREAGMVGALQVK
ncbi:MAG: plastocyanin/azurin family copper-binding protein [Solirubrobacterales bacterium]